MREAEVSVEHLMSKLLRIEMQGDYAGLRDDRHVLQSCKDAVVAMKRRLRKARAKRAN